MPIKTHHSKLTKEEREELQARARKQGALAIKVPRARALLAVDCAGQGPAMTDLEAAAVCGLCSLNWLESLSEEARRTALDYAEAGQVAVHHPRRKNQTPQTVSISLDLADH